MTPQNTTPAQTGTVARRSFLTAALVGTAAVAAPTSALAAERKLKTGVATALARGTSSVPSAPRFVGHQPGRLYLGQSYPGDIADAEAQAGGRFGVHRTFYQWDGGDREDARIREAHANGRLPWVSFKPPGGTSSWSAVGAGTYDADLRVRARRYAGYTKPVIVTFHHEPTNDSP
ncbi:MAG: hypothetical protein ACK5MT_18870, partial [Actinomycetales bacterium]